MRGFAMNKWDTLRDLFSIQERVNRLFEDALGGMEASEEGAAGTWSPVVDIYETEQDFVVEAELPEVRQADIQIKIQDNTLTIEGERKFQGPMTEGYHRIERSHGRFSRAFLLPALVDQESIKATLKDGILQIVLSKKSNALPRQITITGQE
jgi:HSP20 family protein